MDSVYVCWVHVGETKVRGKLDHAGKQSVSTKDQNSVKYHVLHKNNRKFSGWILFVKAENSWVRVVLQKIITHWCSVRSTPGFGRTFLEQIQIQSYPWD